MIASRHTGFLLNGRERLTLRYGLYPLWAISTLGYLTGRPIAEILVAAGCLGLIATSALPDALERLASPWDGEALWPVTLFVALNLHHYLIDATVWRSNGRLVRAVIGPLRRN